MITVLRGAKFRPMDAQVCLLQQTAGSILRLEPEPTNKYDPNAIKVIATDPEGIAHFIGYIAKEDCEEVLGMLAVGQVVAKIAVENGNAPSISVEYDFGDEESSIEDAED